MRTVSALGLVLKARFLEAGKGQVKAYCQPEYQAFLEKKEEKRSENLLSRSPLEKPDTQTSLLKDQCIGVLFFATGIFNNGTVA